VQKCFAQLFSSYSLTCNFGYHFFTYKLDCFEDNTTTLVCQNGVAYLLLAHEIWYITDEQDSLGDNHASHTGWNIHEVSILLTFILAAFAREN